MMYDLRLLFIVDVCGSMATCNGSSVVSLLPKMVVVYTPAGLHFSGLCMHGSARFGCTLPTRGKI